MAKNAASDIVVDLAVFIEDLRKRCSEEATKAIEKHGPGAKQVTNLVKVDDYLRREEERAMNFNDQIEIRKKK